MTLDLVLDIASFILIAAGVLFIVIGAIGLIRLPYLYARMHGASVIETLGAGFLLTGLMLQAGWTLVTVKLLFALILILVTSPVATHAVAQAALAAGIKPELEHDRRPEAHR